MVRFDIRGGNWDMVKRQDGLGAFTWAEEALAYKRSFWSSFFVNVMMVVVCALLSAYLVYHKHDPVPVKQVSVEEYRAAVEKEQKAQAENAGLLRRIEDLGAIRRNLSAQLRTQNAIIAQYKQQLKALAVSVPPQLVILKELQKEAATGQGLRQVVARSFGRELAANIKIVGE